MLYFIGFGLKSKIARMGGIDIPFPADIVFERGHIYILEFNGADIIHERTVPIAIAAILNLQCHSHYLHTRVVHLANCQRFYDTRYSYHGIILRSLVEKTW